MKREFIKTPLSVLDLAFILEGKTITDSFKNSLSLAQTVEKLGYRRFWLAEHHNMMSIASSATSVLIGYVAGGTSIIRVGSGGIMLPNHSPLVIAEQFGTLASLYPNRIDLGLGRAPGTDPLTAKALLRNDYAAFHFPDTVRELQKYLSAENRTAPVRAVPGEGIDIPIWILGSSTSSAKLASSFGLPYAFASHFAPQELMRALDIYRSEFVPSDHLKEPYAIACVNVIAAETTPEARLLATSMEKAFLGIITNARRPLQIPDPTFRLSENYKPLIQQFLTCSFVGNPAEINDQLTDFIDTTQVDELMVVSHIYDHEARQNSYKIVRDLQETSA